MIAILHQVHGQVFLLSFRNRHGGVLREDLDAGLDHGIGSCGCLQLPGIACVARYKVKRSGSRQGRQPVEPASGAKNGRYDDPDA